MNSKLVLWLVLLGLALAGCVDSDSPGKRAERNAQHSAESTSSEEVVSVASTDVNGGHKGGGRLGSGATAGPMPSGRHLRTEASFVKDNAVSLQRAGNAIMSRDFSKLMRAFEREVAADNEARDTTDVYRRAMDEQAQGIGQVTELACGLSLCFGAIKTRDSASYEAWLSKFEADKRTPSYSYGESAVDSGEAGRETRFFFSVDPALRGVNVPARPMTSPTP